MARVEDANWVDSERQTIKAQVIQVSTETRYYISSLNSSVQDTADWGYWVENKVHYVRDVTQGEDKSRIRTTPLVQMFALARNFALNLYHESGFENMAQANRLCSLVWRNSRQYLKWLNDAPRIPQPQFQPVGRFCYRNSTQQWKQLFPLKSGGKQLPFSF